MSSIQFYMPNPKKEQLINVDYNKLLTLNEEISNFSQGTQGATWSDGISELVSRLIWGNVKPEFDDYYLYPGYTSEEIYELLINIKKLSEELNWFPYEKDGLDVITFTPLEEILKQLKSS